MGMIKILVVALSWQIAAFSVRNVRTASKDKVTYDVASNPKYDWKVGDSITFILPTNPPSEVVGNITYVMNMKGSVTHLKDEQNLFVSGTVPMLDGVSPHSGEFEASFFGESTIRANVKYPGHIQYELSSIASPSGSNSKSRIVSRKHKIQKVDMFQKYYSKEGHSQKHVGSSQTSAGSAGASTINSAMQRDTLPSMNGRTATDTALPVLRILVLYTKQAVNACPGEACILSQIAIAIGNFNIALKNSLVDLSVEYVAERIPEYDNYTENADMGVMLNQLGTINVINRRNELSCHAVHLTTANSQSCGMGNYAYNGLTGGLTISFYGCIGGYMTLAHEVGHNLGLLHDQSASPASGNNHGYCWDDSSGNRNCHRSIMAYTGCITPKGKSICDRVKYFSSPNIQEIGSTIGKINVAENAQQIQNNALSFMNQFTSLFPKTNSILTTTTISSTTSNPTTTSYTTTSTSTTSSVTTTVSATATLTSTTSNPTTTTYTTTTLTTTTSALVTSAHSHLVYSQKWLNHVF